MKIKLSDYLAQMLSLHGIKHIFTVTGGGAMHLNDSFGNSKKLSCIYNHNEQACAIAAEGYYKAVFKMPAVCVTTGPGGTNALTGVLGAWLDSVPMLIISGQVKYECTISSLDFPLRQLGDQEYNIIDSVKPMTKYAVMIKDPKSIKYHLEKALYIAKNGRPGPVWLDIPLNVQAAVIDTDELTQYNPDEDKNLLPPEINNSIIEKVAEKLRNSKKPAIIAGSGVRLSGGFEHFQKLIKQLNIPVMTAWNSHDLICDDDPLYAGRPGTVGTRGGNFVFQNCDLLLILGCRMNLRQIGYNYQKIAPNAYKIMVDIDQNELKKPTFKVQLPIFGDVNDFMKKLYKTGFSKNDENNQKWIDWCININKKYPVVKNQYDEISLGINPYLFMKKLFDNLKENQITVTSNGSACVCSFQAAEIKKGQRLFTNSGCASMGYGLPAAIGACVGADKSSIICIEGDGSLQMNIQELQTVIHNRLPVKLFVLNNNGYHSIRQSQSNFFNGNFSGVDKNSGISFPECEKIAAAYGFEFFKIKSSDGAERVIDDVLTQNKPVFCEVVVDFTQNFEPKSSSKVLPDGTMVSAPLEDMYPFLPSCELEENKFDL